MFDYLPDGEQAFIDKLARDHPDLTIGTREPAAPTTGWVRLFRSTGDDRLRGVTGTETYVIESWHKNRESVAATTAMIRATAATMPVNLPDPDGRARYTFHANLTLRHP